MSPAGEPIAAVESGLTKPLDDLVGAASSLAAAGASELFLDGHSVSQQALLVCCKAVKSAFPGPFTLRAEPDHITQVESLLASGASRVAVEDTALEDPHFIAEATRQLGSDALAVAITARREKQTWRVYRGKHGPATEWDAITWARVAEAQGAAEMIIDSAWEAFSGESYDLELLGEVTRYVARPVVACGNPQSIEDCFDALMIGNTDAVLLTPALLLGRRSFEEIRAFFEEHGVSAG